MQLLKPISISSETSYLTCVVGMEQRFRDVSQAIRNVGILYERLAKSKLLNQLPRTSDVTEQTSIVTGNEMRALYTNKFAKQQQPGRPIYDAIKLMVRKCPLCRVGHVRELDHYLPKTHYPALALSPLNLVPVCKDCNYDKRSVAPQSPEEVWPHPYFDDIQQERWLKATLIQSNKPEIEYFVEPPITWSAVTTKRVQAYFAGLSLSDKYSIEAGTRMGEIADILDEIFDEEGESGVSKWLLRNARSTSKRNINHWEVSLYECLASDKWYCTSGYTSFR